MIFIEGKLLNQYELASYLVYLLEKELKLLNGNGNAC
jgi:hypothetical protein